MNRWKYTDPLLGQGESTLTCEKNVRLYDGDQKVTFTNEKIEFIIGFISRHLLKVVNL